MIQMEKSQNIKQRSEIWQIVLYNFSIKHKSHEGLFCILRRRGLITWGEWYYLHDVINKYKAKMPYFHWKKKLIKKFIRKLKQNENRI